MFPLKKFSESVLLDSESPSHSLLKSSNFKLSEAGRHGEVFAILVNHKRTHLFVLSFRDIQGGKGSECLLFITVLTLNVVSDFSVLSLLSVPSRFSAPPGETLGSWSYLSIKAEVSSRRLSLSSGVSRRCLYLGPTNDNALTLLQAVVSIQQVPWTAKYYS